VKANLRGNRRADVTIYIIKHKEENKYNLKKRIKEIRDINLKKVGGRQ